MYLVWCQGVMFVSEWVFFFFELDLDWCVYYVQGFMEVVYQVVFVGIWQIFDLVIVDYYDRWVVVFGVGVFQFYVMVMYQWWLMIFCCYVYDLGQYCGVYVVCSVVVGFVY